MTADLDTAPDPLACCDLDPRAPVSALWFEMLPHHQQREIVRAHGRTLPFPLGSPLHTERNEKYRPGALVVEISIGFPEALHGEGMRLVAIGCNQRARRPWAWAMCGECGRAEYLGRPPRGWPTARPHPRQLRFYALAGWRLGDQMGATTIMRGVAVRATRRIEAPR